MRQEEEGAAMVMSEAKASKAEQAASQLRPEQPAIRSRLPLWRRISSPRTLLLQL